MNIIEILTIIMTLGTVLVLSVFGYWVYRKKLRIWRVCYFYVPAVIKARNLLRGEAGNCVMRFVGEKEIKLGQKFVQYKLKYSGNEYSGQFPVNWERPSDLTDHKTVFSFDVENKVQIQYNANNSPIDCGDVELNALNMENSVLAKLYRDFVGMDKLTTMIILLCIVLAVACLFMGYAFYPILNPVVPSNVTVAGG